MLQFSLKDSLTGLDNSNPFALCLQNSVKHNMELGKNFSLLVLELDGFKQVQEQFGELSSDEVLTCFAEKIANRIRFRDQVFRYGADKFAILLNDAEKISISHIIQRIEQTVTDSSVLSVFNLSCSIGSAEYQDSDNLKSLFARAELALYQAKEKSKNGVKLSA